MLPEALIRAIVLSGKGGSGGGVRGGGKGRWRSRVWRRMGGGGDDNGSGYRPVGNERAGVLKKGTLEKRQRRGGGSMQYGKKKLGEMT